MEFATRNWAIFALSVQILVIIFTSQYSIAYDFYVGGKNGWAPNPSEAFSNWASRNRFQVNDKLVFRYKKGEDSVLVVKKEDYDSCNTSNPIQKMADGNSVFQFDRSGHFFFISGAHDRCEKGEKMVVIVMAVRYGMKNPPAPSPATLPSTSALPSAASPLSAEAPNLQGGFVPAPGPESGESSAAAAAAALSVGRVSIGVISFVLSGVCFLMV